MTHSPPDEALHFRGKTLTPESPRPVHIPEPSNIPVLLNQMDPVFNDTSTYENVRKTKKPPQVQEPMASNISPSLPNGHENGAKGGNDSTEAQGTVPSEDTDPVSFPSLDQQDNPQTSHAMLTALQSQYGSYGKEVNAPNPVVTLQSAPSYTPSGGGGENQGVNFQNLLDNISPSTSTAPAGSVITATATSPAGDAFLPNAATDSSLPTAAGLPPRPPPQDNTSTYPQYASNNEISTYSQFSAQDAFAAQHGFASQQSNYPSTAALTPLGAAPGAAPGSSAGASGLPPPPVATFQQNSSKAPVAPEFSSAPLSQHFDRPDRAAGRDHFAGDDEAPWPPDVQKKYDEFLHDERIYVTEGLWDRFPPGSRLFVGNLPTERVTKRDLFHVFHKYGKLAQISIKQAYGFIQFLDPNACYQALQAEQGGSVRGRNINLEISKPQRNTRPGPQTSDAHRAALTKRPKSPDYGRGGSGGSRAGRSSGERPDRSYDSGRTSFSDFRDEATNRRRDDYRPARSPSPRGYRPREDFRSRNRSPERFDRRDRRRSRSPYGRDRRYRSPSPRSHGHDHESDVPYPRRAARDVPVVQIIALEDVDRKFIYHVENAFKVQGIRIESLTLAPRASLSAVIERQIKEGVLAIIKLSRNHEFSGKIPLQLIDRGGGPDNARFTDYPEMDLNVAVQVVIQAQSPHRSSMAGPPVYAPNPAFPIATQFPLPQSQPAPQLPQASVAPLSNPTQIANMISSLDGPTLQSLLGALQQSQTNSQLQQPAFPGAPGNNPVDLAGLLNTVMRPQNAGGSVMSQSSLPPLPNQAFGMQAPGRPANVDPNLLALLARNMGNSKPQQNPASVDPQFQNIVNQLARWKQ